MRDLLKNLVELKQRSGVKPFGESLLFGVEDFVLRYGQEYELQTLPKPYRVGIPKLCFHNSGNLALEHELIYVEGYASMNGFPIHHAWCVKPGSNKVIDVTSKGFSAYFGVPFSAQTWKEITVDSESSSLLDDWKKDFPVLSMSEDRIKQMILP